MINKDFILGFGAGKSAGGGGGGGGGGGSGMVLIKTESLGTITATDSNQHQMSISCKVGTSDIEGLDVLLLEVTRDTMADNHHYRTVTPIWIQRNDDISTIKSLSPAGAWMERKENGIIKAFRSGTPFGVYVNSMSKSGDGASFLGWYLYKALDGYSGPIDGNYTANIYGIPLR